MEVEGSVAEGSVAEGSAVEEMEGAEKAAVPVADSVEETKAEVTVVETPQRKPLSL